MKARDRLKYIIDGFRKNRPWDIELTNDDLPLLELLAEYWDRGNRHIGATKATSDSTEVDVWDSLNKLNGLEINEY